MIPAVVSLKNVLIKKILLIRNKIQLDRFCLSWNSGAGGPVGGPPGAAEPED